MSGTDGRWPHGSYEDGYHEHVHRKLIQSDLYYELMAREAEAEIFQGIDANAEVFEFGVGLGKNVALLPHRSGYDISEFARSFCRKRGISVFDDLGDVPDNKFDVVLSSHVLEHLDNPLENLQWLRTKLKPGGKLIVVLPVEKHQTVPFPMDANQHLFAWNFRCINNLLQRAEFRIIANRFRYGAAQYKLRYLGRISLRLYRSHTRLLGRILGRRDMIIVAQKC